MTEKDAGERSSWSRAVEALSVFAPPATLATALLIYFGWARADAQAKAMGLSVNLFGYTTRDFVLRSISALYAPAFCLLVAGIGWIAVDRALRRRIEAGRHRTVIARAARVVRVAAVVFTGVVLAVTLFAEPVEPDYGPYLMAVGVLLAAWATLTHRRACAGQVPRTSTDHRLPEAALVLSLVTLLLFWGTSLFAEYRGWQQASMLEQEVSFVPQQEISSVPRAQVFSPQPLDIEVDAVREVRLGTAEEPRYRYDGLRLLTASGGRLFFLHDGWTVQRGKVVVLPDDGSVRVEYGGRPTGT
ncbi:hypothetical protein [Kocuria nitroreducens]|uniref:hypothetical protein n=1 Tax=Kocuria nitroreducens TaxID=3058914 RepID=UPI0036D809AD